jgi:pimeloyl-ACP methyl ester carboxylesterase
VELAFDVSGDGDPVVLIGGTGMPAIAWFAHRSRLEAEGYRTIAFDSRGVGSSSAPDGPYSVEDMAADTAGLIDHLDVAPCHVIGLSLGGLIAESLARSRPGLLRSAVLIGSAGRTSAYERLLSKAELEIAALERVPPSVDVLGMLHESLSSTQLQDEELVSVWAELAGARQWQGPGRFGQAHAALTWGEREDWEPSWGAVQCPVLVMAFEHDIIFPPRVSAEAASHMPRAEFVEVEGQAHGGVMVTPDDVMDIAIEFLQRH